MNPVIIKNTKKYKPKLQKRYNTEQGKIINKRKIQHTLMDSRFCSLTACLKNETNTKGQSAICEGLEKIQKKYNNTNCIFGRNGKIQKKIQKYKVYFFCIKCIFFVFYLYFFRIFLVFLQKKIQKKYECNCSKIQNTKKIRINNFKNTKYKKNTNPKFQKYKIQRKDKFKNKPESQPRVHCGNQETNCKKNTKPTICIFQTLQF